MPKSLKWKNSNRILALALFHQQSSSDRRYSVLTGREWSPCRSDWACRRRWRRRRWQAAAVRKRDWAFAEADRTDWVLPLTWWASLWSGSAAWWVPAGSHAAALLGYRSRCRRSSAVRTCGDSGGCRDKMYCILATRFVLRFLNVWLIKGF